MTGALVELRVLEGPNLYFPRAAVKLTLDLTRLVDADEERARRLAALVGLADASPGPARSGFRQRFAVRAVARLVRQVARESGTTRLAVRVRPGTDVHRVVVAFPWRNRQRAEALGVAVAGVLDGLPTGDLDTLLGEAAARVAAAAPGSPPRTQRPRVPVVMVTGTNGKTTTSRMIAHIGLTHGLHVGWSSTDGIYLDGRLVEPGDYSGPSGAGRVLAHPDVQLAVTETARGGILLRGIGVVSNDVSVVTNVSADHLGLQGIDTLDQLAEVKSVVARITRRDGWAVLNADDPRVLAMRRVTRARPWVFSTDPGSPGIREAMDVGGRATTVIDGWLAVLAPGTDAQPVVEVADIPMTLAGLSRVNVENALAAASAAFALDIPAATVAAGLTGFCPDAEHNPGRMNVYTLDDTTVVVDLAHNEAGLDALLEIMRGLRPPGRRLLLGLGAAGDRTDDVLEALGERAGRDADVVVVGHKERYLRGRTTTELARLFDIGAARVGAGPFAAHPTELAALQALVTAAVPGDVVGLMCHAQREEVEAWLTGRGAVPAGPETLRAMVRASARR